MERNTELESVLTYSGSDRVAHYLEYEREKIDHARSVKSFGTGLAQLDALIGRFETGEVTVISGPTGNGKTLLADSIGQRLMRFEKMPIAWFSYEVPTEKMIYKYTSADDKSALGLYVPMELKAGNVEWIKRKCLEAQLKYNCRAVFIDHLHFIVDMSTQQNMSLNIGGVMRQLKHDVAKALNMIVFIICHQGQPKEQEPSIENIRDSSFVGQESDNVLIVYRSPDPVPSELENNTRIRGYERSYEQGYATVKVEKARRAGTYRKKLVYQKIGHWLEEVF